MGSRPQLSQPLFDDCLFLLARHSGIRRRPRGHLAESTDKDSLPVKPTVGLTLKVNFSSNLRPEYFLSPNTNHTK